jgi:6,7-dimethyl-8-ribityllumazine synthase
MSPTLEGSPGNGTVRVGIVMSRFNEFVTGKLLDGVEACLDHHGCGADQRIVVKVPGAWEVPLAVKKLLDTRRVDTIIALGALIRGETPHFEYLAGQVAHSLGQLGVESGIPTIFGILTTNDVEQALARAGDKTDNKGWEAALTALEMVDLFRRLDRDAERG